MIFAERLQKKIEEEEERKRVEAERALKLVGSLIEKIITNYNNVK